MYYREYKPSEYLAEFIDCYWELIDDNSYQYAEPENVFPDGKMELIFNFGDPVMRKYQNINDLTKPTYGEIHGQITSPLTLMQSGKVNLFAIRFKPGGCYPFTKIPSYELTSSFIPFEDNFKDIAVELTEKIENENRIFNKIQYVENLLCKKFENTDENYFKVQYAINCITNNAANVQIKNISNKIGISERHFERLFKKYVGLSPKFYSRIVRFQSIFREFENPDSKNFADIVYKCGYYDQSHFIKEFYEFTSQTPLKFLSDDHILTEFFISNN